MEASSQFSARLPHRPVPAGSPRAVPRTRVQRRRLRSSRAASAFDAPFHSADGELFGWWFRDDDREQIDDWLSYGVPWKSSPTRRREQTLRRSCRRAAAHEPEGCSIHRLPKRAMDAAPRTTARRWSLSALAAATCRPHVRQARCTMPAWPASRSIPRPSPQALPPTTVRWPTMLLH
jgi:hypothetical protein